MKKLLAKSDGTTLLEHTEDSLKVFSSISRAYSNVPNICRVKNFWEILFISLFFHDIGKAAAGFQKALIKEQIWAYRHEILSASFISLLNGYTEMEKTSIALAIMGHHKDIKYIQARYATYPEGPGKNHYEKRLKEVFTNIDEVNQFLLNFPRLSEKYLGKELSKLRIVEKRSDTIDAYQELILPHFILPVEDEEPNIIKDTFGYFLKGFLTACDHLASGSKTSILKGIQDLPKLYNFDSYRSIQEKAFETNGDSILTAPTGSGKTEAALFWSDNNQNEMKSKRIFYLLPYTASINAMYNRLIKVFNNKKSPFGAN